MAGTFTAVSQHVKKEGSPTKIKRMHAKSTSTNGNEIRKYVITKGQLLEKYLQESCFID